MFYDLPGLQAGLAKPFMGILAAGIGLAGDGKGWQIEKGNGLGFSSAELMDLPFKSSAKPAWLPTASLSPLPSRSRLNSCSESQWSSR